MSEQTGGFETASGNSLAAYFARIEERQGDVNVAAITLSEMALFKFFSGVVEELDAGCPIMREDVCLSGMALMPDDEDEEDSFLSPVIVLEKDEDEGTVYGRVEGVVGVYYGVSIQPHKGDYGNEYRIRHVAIVGEDSEVLGKGTRVRKDTLLGFFERGSTIQLIDEIEESLRPKFDQQELPSEDINQIIDDYSISVVRLINSLKFRR